MQWIQPQQTFRKRITVQSITSGDGQQLKAVCVVILVRGVVSGSFISSSPPQALWSDSCRFARQPTDSGKATDHSEGASVRITYLYAESWSTAIWNRVVSTYVTSALTCASVVSSNVTVDLQKQLESFSIICQRRKIKVHWCDSRYNF